jgi:hypothetical protein
VLYQLSYLTRIEARKWQSGCQETHIERTGSFADGIVRVKPRDRRREISGETRSGCTDQ